MTPKKPDTIPPHPKKKATVKSVTVSASTGAKIQIVQFQFTADFHMSYTENYDLEGYTEAEAEAFRLDKLKQLREQLEPTRQEAIDEFTELRDKLREAG